MKSIYLISEFLSGYLLEVSVTYYNFNFIIYQTIYFNKAVIVHNILNTAILRIIDKSSLIIPKGLLIFQKYIQARFFV